MNLRRSLLAAIGLLSILQPAQALVEPEIDAWQAMVKDVRQVSELPGSDLFPEALAELGGLGSDLMKAPLGDLMTELEQRRNLKFKYFTPWHVKDRTELRAWFKIQLAKEYTPKKIDETVSMLRALGLVKADFQLVSFMEELLTQQVAGVYDPGKDQFFLVDTAAGRTLKERTSDAAAKALLAQTGLQMGDQTSIVTIHELDHALGGQYFPVLQKFGGGDLSDWSTDQQMAVQALIEGDATFIMIDHQNKWPAAEMGERTFVLGADMMAKMVGMAAMFPIPLPGMSGFSTAPLYFQKALMFPYFNGAELITELRHSGYDWGAVDAAYTALPTSTEQVFHPTTYEFVASQPHIPTFAKLPTKVGPWSKVVDDTGGEFLVRVVLEQYGVSDFAGAAEGWDGDRIRVYRNSKNKKLAFVWVLNWDTAADAKQFAAAARATTPFKIEPGPKSTLLSLGFDAATLARLRPTAR